MDHLPSEMLYSVGLKQFRSLELVLFQVITPPLNLNNLYCTCKLMFDNIRLVNLSRTHAGLVGIPALLILFC